MTIHTRLSEKGQVVVPKSVRDMLGWRRGDRLEVVVQSGSVNLRAAPEIVGGPTAAEVLTDIWAMIEYDGPPVTDDDIDDAMMEMIDEKWAGR